MNRYVATLALMTLVLSACGDTQETRLEGARLDLTGQDVDLVSQDEQTVPSLRLAAATENSDWTHLGGSAQHMIANAAFSSDPQPLWSTAIGSMQTKRSRSNVSPVVANSTVFAMDSQANVSAVNASGDVIWQVNLVPYSDFGDQGASGGMSTDGDLLFVTSGFGELVALDTANGNRLWSQDLEGFGGGAPTVYEDIVYVSGRDGTAWAIDKVDGRILWQIAGAESKSGILGGSSVAVGEKFAIFPFATGEVLSVYRLGGRRNWTTVLGGARLGRAISAYSDLTGDPVIQGNRVFVGNSSGRLVAIDMEGGDRLWTSKEGVSDLISTSGASLFFVSDQNELIRLSAATGEVYWRQTLPRFTTDKVKRRKGTFAHFGPILANGNIIVPSSDGVIRIFDAESGALETTLDIPSGASGAPAIANGALYVISNAGVLHAYR